MEREYGEGYRDLFEKHWWWRARTEYIIETLRRFQVPGGWTNILDVGCGDALFFDRLAEFGDVEGVEPSQELVNPNNPYRNGIHVCPFDESFQPGKKYSLILMLDVLEHLERPAAALKHAVDLLVAGGTFVATVPAFMVLWTNHDVLNQHRIRYTKSTLREQVKATGLKIEEERYLYHWTVPVKLGVRAAERILHLRPRLPDAAGGWMNRIFYQISRLEQKTLSRLPMPFGSSLLVVGRKET
ncbi:MAG: class I SAM-dependent methyltransferase [Terriglobales bacterium]